MAGNTTLSQLAVWMNSQGFRTRNMHRLPSSNDSQAAGPKLFTTASVRGILHNPFYSGKIKHLDQLLPGSHQALVSDELFQQVQSAMKCNSGRSETLHPRPDREYLLKGLVKCAHCGMALWAQTLKSGSRPEVGENRRVGRPRCSISRRLLNRLVRITPRAIASKICS